MQPPRSPPTNGLERSFPWKCLQILARVLTTVLFELKVRGQGHVPASGGALIVSNHQGNMDPVLLAVRLDRPVHYIAKSDLFASRLGGWLLRGVFNSVPVRLGAADVGAIKETIRRLRDGHLLNMYPEGARTPDGSIGRMHDGVALIIRRAKVPVVPAVIVGSFEAWPIQRAWYRCRPIRVVYGEPMDLSGMSAAEIVVTIDRTLRRMFEDLNGAKVRRTRISRDRASHLDQPAKV